jgi:hypothetical protein
MKRNWNDIAAGYGLDIPAADIDRMAPALDLLEAAFRPQVARLALDLEPVVIFRAGEDE